MNYFELDGLIRGRFVRVDLLKDVANSATGVGVIVFGSYQRSRIFLDSLIESLSKYNPKVNIRDMTIVLNNGNKIYVKYINRIRHDSLMGIERSSPLLIC